MTYETSINYDDKKWIIILILSCQYWRDWGHDIYRGQVMDEGINIEIEEFQAYHKGDDATWFNEDDAKVLIRTDYNKIWKQWRKENE